MTGPQPSRAAWSGNDYSGLERRLGLDASTAPVSLVMPSYNRADRLARSLAAATHLDAPAGGLEIVVADDGSTDATAEVVRAFESRLDITHVRRPDRGHRLAEICNVGLRTARHDRIVLLQSDMVPSRGLLAAYGRWFDLETPVLLIGMRRFTCADHLTAEAILGDPGFEARLPEIRTGNEMWRERGDEAAEDWRLPIYRGTNWLKAEPAPFRAVVGSNLAFRRDDALRLGGFCEAFQSWGGEDGEFGYRAYLAGLALVPVAEAVAYHQEPPGGVNETDRRQGFESSRRLREDRCALPPFRRADSPGPHRVPRVAVGRRPRRGSPLDDETLARFQAQTFSDGPEGAPAAHRLATLAATVAAPYLLICGETWPKQARLAPEALDPLLSGAADGVLIEAPAQGLLIGARAWNRVATELDPAALNAGLDALVGRLMDRLVLQRWASGALEAAHVE